MGFNRSLVEVVEAAKPLHSLRYSYNRRRLGNMIPNRVLKKEMYRLFSAHAEARQDRLWYPAVALRSVREKRHEKASG
jgi:hypothetical protein